MRMTQPLREDFVVGLNIFGHECDEYDPVEGSSIGIHEPPDDITSHLRSIIRWIAIDTRADSTQRQRLKSLLLRQLQRLGVTAPQQRLALLRVSRAIHRANSMDHMPGRQFISLGDLGLPRGTAADGAALLHEFRTSGAVNGAVNTATAEKGRIGGVDNGINFKGGDVGPQQGYAGIVLGGWGK